MPFTLPFTPTEITAFKDIALGLSAIATGSAAVATATFAYKGLNKWQLETSFKANFELAKEVVEVTYKIDNTINRLRRTVYGIGGQAGIDTIRNTKLRDLMDLHDHFQTLSVQIKALFNNEKWELSNKVIITSGLVISDIDQLLIYLEERYHFKAELSAREEDVINGHEVSQNLLDKLKKDHEECDEAYKDIHDRITLAFDKSKPYSEYDLTRLIEVSTNDMVESMDIYLKAK
jgi:hypothetical protein